MIKMNRNDMLYNIVRFIALFIIIKPAYITENPSLSNLNSACNYLQIIIMCFLFILIVVERWIEQDNIIFNVILCQVVLAIPTFLYNGSYRDYFSMLIQLLDIVLLVSFYYMKKGDFYLLRSLHSIMSALLLSNFVVMIMWPDGWYNRGRWMFGMENNMLPVILPGIFICLFYSLKYHKRIVLTIIVCITGTFEIFLGGSATSIVAIILFWLLIVVYLFIHKIPNEKIWLIIAVIVSIGLIFFSVQNYFSFIIVDILEKDTTLSLRDVVWRNALKYIPQKPLLGYGIESANVTISKITGMHMHNTYLDVLYKSGIIGLFGNFFMLRKSVLKRNSNSLKYDFLFTAVTAALFIAFIAEVYTKMPLVYCIIALVYFERRGVEEHNGIKKE